MSALESKKFKGIVNIAEMTGATFLETPRYSTKIQTTTTPNA